MSKIVKKLPIVLQTDAQNKFFEATFEQLFQKKQSKTEIGFIGRKAGGRFDPVKDYFLEEIDPARTNYQLEPVAYTKDPNDLSDSNVMFYEDFLNYLKQHNGLVNNHERLFRTSQYSYAPPIDIDKFINYQNYFWIREGLPAIAVPYTSNELVNYFTNNPQNTAIVITDGTKSIALSTGMHILPSDSSGVKIFQQSGQTVELADVDSFVLPFNQYEQLSWDNFFEPWDSLAWDEVDVGLDIDYITIQRGTQDKNGWSRTNRWYHRDVVFNVLGYNNTEIPNYIVAERPIIEFVKNIELYRSGTQFLQYVDFIETEKSLSGIQGTASTDLIDGNTVQDGDQILIVNGELPGIFTVNIASGTINLTESTIIYTEGDIVISASGQIPEDGGNRGKTYYYNEGVWTRATTEKFGKNQPPLFNAYDNNSVALDDPAIYPNSSFSGNKIFSYKENEFSPITDSALGFSLTYDGLGQLGDAVFENNIGVDKETWAENAGDDRIAIAGYYYYNNISTSVKSNSWYIKTTNINTTAADYFETSKQRVNDRYVVLAAGNNQFTMSQPSSDVIVYKNGSRVSALDYTVSGPKVTLSIGTSINDVIEIKSYNNSAGLGNTYSLGYYEIPANLESNPTNQEIQEASQNKLSSHFVNLIESQEGIIGQGLGLNNNYRDTNKDLSLGTKILQTNDPLPLAMLSSSSTKLDIIQSIRFAKNEYTRYRNKFIKTAALISSQGIGTIPTSDNISISKAFNEAIARIVQVSENANTFQTSYMFGFGGFVEEVLEAGASNYVLSILGDLESDSSAMYLYDGESQLIDGYDYSVVSANPIEIEFNTAITNDITVRIYPLIGASCIPATPSKLGMYPVYKPEIVTDTTYLTPFEIIVGHDGSRTPLTGNVIIDAMLLEFETRIYNGIDAQFKDVDYLPPLIKQDVFPSTNNVTDYTRSELVAVYKQSLSSWASTVQANLTSNETYDSTQWQTYNFAEGSWKKIYQDTYGTVRPWETPWEMLGFSQEPDWWADAYSNPILGASLMWTDLTNGEIRDGARAGVDSRFARPHLVNDTLHITQLTNPVDIGLATDPLVSGIPIEFDRKWQIGEVGPAENGWENTEVYPFAMMELLFLTKPARFGYRFWNTKNTITSNANSNQLINPTTLTRTGYSELLVHGETSNGNKVYKTGYQQWISDKLNFLALSPTTDFGDLVRRLDVKLGYRVAGFTNPLTIETYLESTSSTSTGNNLLVPSENISVDIHTSPAISEFNYSGVIIVQSANGKFVVGGYNSLDLEFNIIPRNPNAPKRQITVGAENAKFRIYSIGSTYSKNEIVKYNGTFYRALADIESVQFNDSEWQKLTKLPSTSGVSVVYTMKGLPNTVEKIQYDTEFDTIQEVFDFLISYGDYLESQGWIFDEVDNIKNVTLDWLTSAKDFLFWAGNSWQEGSAIRLSPSSDKCKLNLIKGYAKDLTFQSNGVYNLLDENGAIIPATSIKVERNEREVQVKSLSSNTGIYLMRVYAFETEHRMTFDNITSFNDIVYDPLLGVRQNRLEYNGQRTQEWIGKKEAPGYIITANNQLVPNFDTLIESIRRFHDTETRLDRPQVEDTARHLIGFENKSYLDDLDIREDTQYQFYQGMIRQKGTSDSINKILRSNRVSGKQEVSLYEEYAFKVGEYGASCTSQELNLLIDSSQVKSNPQIISLVTPGDTTGTIKKIIVTSAEYVYQTAPVVLIDNEPNRAYSILSATGKISSIIITNPGEGYTQEPSVTIEISDGVLSPDTAIAILEMTVTPDDPLDGKITIDIDDNTKWLTKPTRGCDMDSLWRTDYQEPVFPWAGPVLTTDYAKSFFNIDAMIGETVAADSVIHMSRTPQRSWGIYKTVVDTGLTFTNDGAGTLSFNKTYNSDLSGVVTIDNAIYSVDYTKVGFFDSSGANIEDIVFVDNNVITLLGNGYIYDATTDEFVSSSSTASYTLESLLARTYEAGDVLMFNTTSYVYSYDVFVTDANGDPVSADIVTGIVLAFKTRKFESVYSLDLAATLVENAEEGDKMFVNYNDGVLPLWGVYDRTSSGYTTSKYDYTLTGEQLFSPANIRAQQPQVVTELFNTVFLYEYDSKDTLARLNVYNPIKGFIPGRAEQNIDIKTYDDPAKYTTATDVNLINTNLAFGVNEVGMTWLDLSSFAYLEYEQGPLEYRRQTWGKLSPGSDVSVYEWVESLNPPSTYTGAGTVRNTTDYTVISTYNNNAGYNIDLYYFWVRGNTSIPTHRNSRTESIANVEQLIRNPRSQGFQWFAAISPQDFVIANAENILENNETVAQINYKTTYKDTQEHKEWYLMSENKKDSVVKSQHWNKMTDSLCGFTDKILISDMPFIANLPGAEKVSDTEYQLAVPNPVLSELEKYGQQNRPRQSWFKNVQRARRVFVESINNLLQDINLSAKGIDFSQEISTNLYWETVTWYKDGFSFNDLIPKFIVTNLSEIPSLGAQLADVIKVEPINDEVYYVSQLEGIIAVENATVIIKDILYTDFRSATLRTELREILNLLESKIFIDELLVRKNLLFFAMVNYVMSEQKDIDWVFKTSYISVEQQGVQLEQSPTLVNDPFDSFLSYINEVKPYSTKVRDYKNNFSTLDLVNVNIAESDTKKIKLKFDRTVPSTINTVRTLDGGAFDPTEIPWDLIDWYDGNGWDGFAPIDYYIGAMFIESESVPSLSSATIGGTSFALTNLASSGVRSVVTIPTNITAYENVAVYINGVQTLNYIIIGDVLAIDGEILTTDEVVLYEIAPANAQNFLAPEETVGSAQELIPVTPQQGIVLQVRTRETVITLPGSITGTYPIIDSEFCSVRVDGTERTDFVVNLPVNWSTSLWDASGFDQSTYQLTFNEDQVGSTVEIVYPPVGYRIHADMDGNMRTERILDQGIVLAQSLDMSSTSITLNDATNLPDTLLGPEVVWVGGERIVYTSKTGNVLNGITRGTRNTNKLDKAIGTKVYYGGVTEEIPNGDKFNNDANTNAWVDNTANFVYNVPNSITLSTTPQAKFLRICP